MCAAFRRIGFLSGGRLGGLNNLGSSSSSEDALLGVRVGGIDEWEEFSLPNDTVVSPSSFFLTNPNGLSISDAGYLISPTQIPLDQLKATDLPNGGAEFTPLPGLDTPEPSSLLLTAGGFMLLLEIALRRNRDKKFAS